MVLRWLKQPMGTLIALVSLAILLLLQPLCLQAQSEQFTVKFGQESLEQALIKLRSVTGSSIAYSKDELKAVMVKPAEYTNKTVVQILNGLVAGLSFTIEKRSGAWLVKKIGQKQPTLKKPGRIIGKIIDEENGQALADASIRIGGKGTVTAIDGSFTIALPAGKYEAEITSIGYGKKIVTEIEVEDNGTFEVSITLNRDKNQLAGVVVKSNAKNESTAALYTRQKNEAGISNGISREQIAALPDKNIGEVLKRISGVSTNDNKRVVIRGIAERYNLAMLDGVILPSTDVQVRDFEFDIIPSNLIDNVVVSKTTTPDMSFGFGGGLVQINTFAIPNQDFTTIGIGGKYINASTGKDFLGYGRGKNDYLGFDDGGRDHYPKDIFTFDNKHVYNPRDPYNTNVPAGAIAVTPQMIAEQNKKIGGTGRLGTRTYTAAPGQNYQFSLGRSYNLKNNRIGYVGSVSYRNEQATDDIATFERGAWRKLGSTTVFDAETGKELSPTTAKQYNFTTTWGALLNMGWSSRNHKITSRNFYSRVFSNQFFRIEGWGNDIGTDLPAILEYDRPKFIDLLQNRVNGEHTIGNVGFNWSIARNKVTNQEQDAIDAGLAPVTGLNGVVPVTGLNGVVYNYVPGGSTNPGAGTLSRSQNQYDETNWMADAAVSYKFRIGKLAQSFKTGLQYLDKKGEYKWNVLPIGTVNSFNHPLRYVAVQNWTPDLEFKNPLTDIYYYPAGFNANNYIGKNNNQAYYAMLDNRFTSWLRLVWGFRAEYYKYEKVKDAAADLYGEASIQNAAIARYVDPVTGNQVHETVDASSEEKKWQYLPSANLTITPVSNFNIRASYAKSAVRPSLIENSSFSRYNYLYGRIQRNVGVLSTVIDHYDLRLEYYPAAGEVISAGVFKKHFKNPVELYLNVTNSSQAIDLMTANSDYADVMGLELDLRKNLSFIYPRLKFLKNIYLSGNLTLQKSEVQASTFRYKTMGPGGGDNNGNGYTYRTKTYLKEKRPLYGQVPVLYNVGLQYAGNRLGTNIAFNHTGYKTFTVGMLPEYSESERPRNQLDAQLSYRFLKSKKLETRLNISNLLNSPFRFYSNTMDTYKRKPGTENMDITEWSDAFEWKYGFSEKYEEGYYETSADGKKITRLGDKDTFIRKVGVAFSLSLSYSF